MVGTCDRGLPEDKHLIEFNQRIDNDLETEQILQQMRRRFLLTQKNANIDVRGNK